MYVAKADIIIVRSFYPKVSNSYLITIVSNQFAQLVYNFELVSSLHSSASCPGRVQLSLDTIQHLALHTTSASPENMGCLHLEYVGILMDNLILLTQPPSNYNKKSNKSYCNA